MAVKWSPSGVLDVSSDPSEMPVSIEGRNAVSGGMTRCKNMHLDSAGIARTRYGSTKLNSTAIGTPVYEIIEVAGYRYAFAGTQIYRDEVSIATGMTSAQWSAAVYMPFNSETKAIYALNGTDRKRIEGATVTEWGIAAPTVAPTVSNGTYSYTHPWERTYHSGDVPIGQASDDSGVIIDWGSSTLSSDIHYTVTHGWERSILSGAYSGPDWTPQSWHSAHGFKWSSIGDTHDWMDRFQKREVPNRGEDAWRGSGAGTKVPEQDRLGKAKIIDSRTLLSKDPVAGESSFDFRSRYTFGWFGRFSRRWEQNTPTTVQSTTPTQVSTDVEIYPIYNFGFVYTYCRKEGDLLVCESNPSPATYLEINEAGVVSWTAPSDSQVTHVRLYRTLPDSGQFYYAGEFAIGATNGTATVSDEELGWEVEVDHYRPPAGTIVYGPNFSGVMFIAKGNKLYYSKPKQPEYWPLDNWVEVGTQEDPIKALAMFGGTLYAFTQLDVYQIQGTGSESFFPIRMGSTVGALSQNGVSALGNAGIARFYNDGVWIWASSNDVKATEMYFRPVFEGDDAGTIDGLNRTYASNGRIFTWHNNTYIAFPGGSETYCSEIIRLNQENKKASHYDYGRSFSAFAIDKENDRIIAGDSSGYLWVLEDSSKTHDDTTDIEWELESNVFSEHVRQYFPRYAKFDIYLTAGAWAFGKIVLDDTLTQVFAVRSRDPKKRLVKTCTGKRLTLRITGGGDAMVYGAEVE